jgi:hypothetical protein
MIEVRVCSVDERALLETRAHRVSQRVARAHLGGNAVTVNTDVPKSA